MEGNIARDISQLRERAAANPDSVSDIWNLADAYAIEAMYEEALEAYNSALKLDPANADLFNELGNVYEELGALDSAEKSYYQAISLRPNHANAYYNLGLLYESIYRIPEAFRSYAKSLELSTDIDEWREVKEKLETINRDYDVYGKKDSDNQIPLLFTQQAVSRPGRFVQHWILGMDMPHTSHPSGAARWIGRPFRMGVSAFLLSFLVMYGVSCIYDGILWSQYLSPWYGLKIFRLLAVLILSVINVARLPITTSGDILLFTGLNALIFLPFGVLHGLTLSPAGSKYAADRGYGSHTVILLLMIALLFAFYFYTLFSTETGFLLMTFIFTNTMSTLMALLIPLIWLGRNLYLSRRANQNN